MTTERERKLLQGQSLQQAGRLDEAKAQYRHLVANDPDDPLAMHYLGMAEHQSGENTVGFERVDRSLIMWPKYAVFHANRASLALESGDVRAAQAGFSRAICLQTDLAAAYLNLGLAQRRSHPSSDIVYRLGRSILLDPNSIQARLETIKVADKLSVRGAFEADQLLRVCFELTSLAPGFVDGLRETGATLGRLNRVQLALMFLRRAITIQSDHSLALADLGRAVFEFGQYEEGLMLSLKAYVLAPASTNAATNSGMCCLLLGRYSEGWVFYESRLRMDSFWSGRDEARGFFERLPLFSGLPSSLGKRVLVWAEQGVGDEVMFGGLVGEFRGLCGELLLQVDRRLMGLFERALPGVRVFERGKTVPAELYDEQIPMGSLGKWLRPSRESFEGKGGRYLQAQEGLGRRLRAELGVGASEKLIGLSWRSASAETGAARSLSLKDLVGALQGVEGVRFLNLQYGEVSEELRALREETGVEVLTHPGIDNREDLEGLAGLIEGCDLVVSVGNATAHLSGALGQKTWVLLPYVAGWRWLHEGERCPWYQSVRLYRQAERGEWAPVLAMVRQNLVRNFL
jgi:tetratricopeptide (TPR) repeat protein